jgi:hypothetical protein
MLETLNNMKLKTNIFLEVLKITIRLHLAITFKIKQLEPGAGARWVISVTSEAEAVGSRGKDNLGYIPIPRLKKKQK